MGNPPGTIDEVIGRLDDIIDAAIKSNNPLGIFAYVYRMTTEAVRDAIRDKAFEDNERLERFDVHFAGLYIDAFERFMSGKSYPQAWQVAFRNGNEKLTILQHIMLGMNAHINYDLGIAASSLFPGDKIDGFRNDFMKVNGIITGLTNKMQDKMSRVSPLMFLLDWAGMRKDEVIINFSIVKAREQAWSFAQALARAGEEEKAFRIAATDKFVMELGQILRHAKGRISAFILRTIARFEEKDLKKIIAGLEI